MAADQQKPSLLDRLKAKLQGRKQRSAEPATTRREHKVAGSAEDSVSTKQNTPPGPGGR
jgi:hypothetical protein